MCPRAPPVSYSIRIRSHELQPTPLFFCSRGFVFLFFVLFFVFPRVLYWCGLGLYPSSPDFLSLARTRFGLCVNVGLVHVHVHVFVRVMNDSFEFEFEHDFGFSSEAEQVVWVWLTPLSPPSAMRDARFV